MFNSKHKKMMELIKRKRDIGVPLTPDEMAYESASKYSEGEGEDFQTKVKFSLFLIAYLISLIFSRSNPIFSAFLGTVTLFVGFILFNLDDDGKINLNEIHKKDGFGSNVFMLVSLFAPLYFGVFLGYQDQKFESFLLKNECKYIENDSAEAEYYCSKPEDKLTRSDYDYVESNGGFNSNWKK